MYTDTTLSTLFFLHISRDMSLFRQDFENTEKPMYSALEDD